MMVLALLFCHFCAVTQISGLKASCVSRIKHYMTVMHTMPAHSHTISTKLSFFSFNLQEVKRWLSEESGLAVLALIYEAFQLLSLVIQTHADCQKRHDSRQRGIFFNALSQQCAYIVDKGMLAAVEQIERERVRGEHKWMSEQLWRPSVMGDIYLNRDSFLGAVWGLRESKPQSEEHHSW